MTRSKVGRDGPRCGAKLRQGEGTCTQVAGWGTGHVGEGSCKLHGGATRSVTKGANRVLLERQAAEQLARLDVAPVADPLTELSKLAGQVLAWRDALAEKVNELTSVRYENSHGGEQLRAEVALFERSMDRCVSVLAAIARLDIDTRLMRISEAQAEQVVQAIRRTFAAVDLTPEQQAQANIIVARELRALSNGSKS
ncbi:hypothetical protein ABIA35_006013 [Catenulispora sp. MAP12-49]|uniref:hypothetical protein n=1 Tax=Catenulispora sp. MAP12-49 TaxID=3156302 RepID=UPI003514B77E